MKKQPLLEVSRASCFFYDYSILDKLMKSRDNAVDRNFLRLAGCALGM